MIPSVLDELKEGKYEQTAQIGYICFYETESGWRIVDKPFNRILVNAKKVSWLLSWRIRKELKNNY
jgi:hypothetical protein